MKHHGVDATILCSFKCVRPALPRLGPPRVIYSAVVEPRGTIANPTERRMSLFITMKHQLTGVNVW